MSTWSNIPEDDNLNIHNQANLTYHTWPLPICLKNKWQTDIPKGSSTSVKIENNIRATIHRNIVYIKCLYIFKTVIPGPMLLDCIWNVMAHGDAREEKWRGNWRMEWVASTCHTTSEHGVSSITTADAHTSAASSQLNWCPCWFKWTRPFRQKTKSGFWACAIIFQTNSTHGIITPSRLVNGYQCFRWTYRISPIVRFEENCHDGGSVFLLNAWFQTSTAM